MVLNQNTGECACIKRNFNYVLLDNQKEAKTGYYTYKFDKVEPQVLKQTPRLLKEQAFCKQHKNMGYATKIEDCVTKMNSDTYKATCAKGDGTFTWDPANKGWCSCCTDVKTAIKYVVRTRDKECKIYKAKNDRSDKGATAWNGAGFTGNKEIFTEGWYDIRKLRSIGNDRMTGLDVPAHLKVTLYQHHRAMGKKQTFYGPYENLAVPNWQRTVSGLRVEKNENFVD